MVKKLRKTNVSGLSCFLEAFDGPSLSPTPSTGPSKPNLKRGSDSLDSETEIRVKRKAGLLGPGNEAYDATGLVPFYTDSAQVPTHLQKCMCVYELLGV